MPTPLAWDMMHDDLCKISLIMHCGAPINGLVFRGQDGGVIIEVRFWKSHNLGFSRSTKFLSAWRRLTGSINVAGVVEEDRLKTGATSRSRGH